jgi:very-short-patch-repair endonuclease
VSVHGRRYDYSLVAYSRWNESVTIVCRSHGPFRQLAQAHYRGAGCPHCARVKQTPSGIVDTRSFIEAARRVHGDTYDYSLSRFAGVDVATTIVCSQHGKFAQRPSLHIGLRNGCPVCAREKRQLSREQFLHEVSGLYVQEFDYSVVPNRVTSRMRITVICPEHGEFDVSAAAHRRGSANCPDCKRSSRFERTIARILVRAGIPFETQWSHPSLRRKMKLRFDFMLPEARKVIEYDGAFHHKPIQMPGQTPEDAERAHRETLERDEIKTIWAERNGWTLIRLSRPHRIQEDLTAAGITRLDAGGTKGAT